MNLKGPLLTGSPPSAAAHMEAGGSAINISSKASLHPSSFTVAYAVASWVERPHQRRRPTNTALAASGLMPSCAACCTPTAFTPRCPHPAAGRDGGEEHRPGRIASDDEIVGTALFLASDAVVVPDRRADPARRRMTSAPLAPHHRPASYPPAGPETSERRSSHDIRRGRGGRARSGCRGDGRSQRESPGGARRSGSWRRGRRQGACSQFNRTSAVGDAVMPTYSISFRLQRTTTEVAFVSVPVSADRRSSSPGTGRIDVNKMVERAIEMEQRPASRGAKGSKCNRTPFRHLRRSW